MTMMLSRTKNGNGHRENGATSTRKIMYPMTKITVNELKWFMLILLVPLIYYDIIVCSRNSRHQVRNNLYLLSFFFLVCFAFCFAWMIVIIMILCNSTCGCSRLRKVEKFFTIYYFRERARARINNFVG